MPDPARPMPLQDDCLSGQRAAPDRTWSHEPFQPMRQKATGQLGSNRLSLRRETLEQIEAQGNLRIPIEAIADFTLEMARRLIYYRSGSVYHYETQKGELVEIASKYGGLDGAGAILQSTPWIGALKAGSQSILDDGWIPPDCAIQGITSILVTPLIDQGKFFGALCLGLTYSCEFRPDLMEITQEFADGLARAASISSREVLEPKAIQPGGCIDPMLQMAAEELRALQGSLHPGKIRQNGSLQTPGFYPGSPDPVRKTISTTNKPLQ